MTLIALPLAALAGASPSPSPSIPEIDPARATPGLWGLFFFVVLGLATWVLFRSMNKQLKRVTFDETGPTPDGPTPDDPTPDGPIPDDSGATAPGTLGTPAAPATGAPGGDAQSDPGPARR